MSVTAWPFLTLDQAAPDQNLDIGNLEWQCLWVHDHLPPEATEAIPRPYGRHRVVLHLFSGRRRHGDIQYYMDSIAQQQQDFILHVISLDIVIDELLGDVTKASTSDFWLDSIRRGLIIALISGPPCETWSRARGVQLEGSESSTTWASTRGPRILRALHDLWGFDCLTIRELHQVCVGNALLGFTLLALLELAAVDGYGLLEHPAEPEDDAQAASIWRLPLVKTITELPHFELLRFSQGLLGAKSPKPTNLLTLRMPGLIRCLHSHRLCTELPRGTSIGKSTTGLWQTSSLKEYPPAMCLCLATALLHSISSRPIDSTVADPPSDFLATCEKFVQQDLGGHFGADYAQRDRRYS